MNIPFAASPRSTIGVEWELALVDATTYDLRHEAETILPTLHTSPPSRVSFKGELLTNTIEITTGVCRSVADARADLVAGLSQLRTITDPLNLELMSAGTHPFAEWSQQHVTDQPRYAALIERTQWWGRQMLIYGVHVHIGIEHRQKVLPLLAALTCYLPHVQSLAASSPFWAGQDTHYASNRALMFQQLPTAGLPHLFENWAELERYTEDMLRTTTIRDYTELRWDVRPAPQFGTIELRVCDGLTNLQEVLALTAFSQCLVEYLSTRIDHGLPLPSMPLWFTQENKWRSARYGLETAIITTDGTEQPLRDAIARLLDELEPIGDRLNCATELASIAQILHDGASYQRQRAVAAQSDGRLDAVAASLVAEMRAGHPLPQTN